MNLGRALDRVGAAVELARGLWDAGKLLLGRARKPSKRVDAPVFTEDEIERARVRRFHRESMERNGHR